MAEAIIGVLSLTGPAKSSPARREDALAQHELDDGLKAFAGVQTCIANDYSFDEVFSRQVLGLGNPGDCLRAISTSGNSRNVIRAVGVAGGSGIRTIGFLGRDGGLLRGICNLALAVPSRTTARIQEAHMFIGHTLCAMIESRLGLG
jgi:D-sedoheptulose 7-phosphate isomerase